MKQIISKLFLLFLAVTALAAVPATAQTLYGDGGHRAPLDFQQITEFDDFLTGNPTNGQIGKLGWNSNNTGGGSIAYIDSTTERPGLFRLTTGTTSGNVYTMHLSGNAAANMIPDSVAFTSYDFRWIIQPGSTADIGIRCGLIPLAYSAADPPAHGLFFRYDTSLGDTAWMVVSSASGSTTAVTTGVTPSASSYYALKIRSAVAGTVLFSITTDGGTFGPEISVCASGCDITTNIPATAMNPTLNVTTRTGSAKHATIDVFGMLINGLSRSVR